MIVDELVAILGYDIRGEQNLRRFNQGLERTAATAQRMAMALVAAGTLAAGAFAGLAKSVLETGSQFEKLGLQLEMLEGNSAKAKDRLEWLKQFAIDTPLSLSEATDAYVKLKNFGLDPLDGSLQAIVDANSMMAGSQDRLKGVIVALGQAWTKQKFQAEEANQLLERGVPAWELLSQAMGKSTQEVMALSEKGKIGRKEIRMLIEQMGKRAKGASERFAKTFEGITGKIKDQWEGFKKEIADAGFFRDTKAYLQRLSDEIVRLQKNGDLKRWAKSISSALSGSLNFAAGQIKGLIGDLKFLFGWIKLNPDWWGPIKTGLMAIGAVMFPKTAALLVLQDVLRWMQGKGSLIGDFAKSLSELTGLDAGTSGTLLASLATAGAAFILFGGTFGKVAAGIRSLAIALGLMGGAQAVAGTATMTALTGGGIASGLLAIAAAAAAAAGSIKLFYDAWKNDEKLNGAIKDKFGKGVMDWFADNIMGGNRPDTAFANDNPLLGGQNKSTPGGGNNIKISGDLMDWKLAEAAKEEQRARYARWGSNLENARFNALRSGGGMSGGNTVVNAPVSTIVNMTVKMEQAATAAANAVREKVSSALSTVPTHPTRVTKSPTF